MALADRFNILAALGFPTDSDAAIELTDKNGLKYSIVADVTSTGLLIEGGKLTVASGGIVVTAGGFTVTAGGFTITAGVLSQDDATDTTSTVTGSIHTDGGVGIAKALWVGTTSRLVGALTLDGALISDLDTDTTSATTGAIQTDGGVGIVKALWVGTTSRLVGAVQADAAVSVGTTLTLADGGIVTQGSSTTTTVVLDTNSGQITTFAGTLAAGGEESFTVTNSVVAVTDTPVVAIVSSAGNGLASASVTAVGAGSFQITVTNLDAAAAFNALHVISFAIIKGSAS